MSLARMACLPAAAMLLAGCQHLGGSGAGTSDASVVGAGDSDDIVVRAPSRRHALETLSLPLLEDGSSEPVDLIERLRSRFALERSDEQPVQTERRWFANNENYLHRVFERGNRYLFHIAEALEERDMPADFALLPIIESAFDPFAYSHGRAAGLWQIIPGTGRQLGLKQNWWYDGRRDVLESTRAALDYLEELSEAFDGDWLLAAAGYNAGPGNVRRAMRRAEAAGARRLDFWSIRPYLPRETRTYVPRLLALRDVVAEPDLFGVTLPALEDVPYFVVVEVEGQIDMSLAASLADVDPDELYQLNAGVNRWATDPDGPHRLLVPYEQADTLTVAVAELGERERVQWTRHRIERGESLISIASRYRTTAETLREVNDLNGNLIRAGDHLMVPHAVAAMGAYTQTADARLERQQNRAREGQRHTHVVRSGESLWSIARRYEINVRQLASWNGMAPGDVLSVGRELVLWTEGEGPSTQSELMAAVALPAAGAGAAGNAPVRRVTYTVRRGDSLYSIAQRFRVTVANLVEWNQVSTGSYLQPGQTLVLYVNVVEQST